MVVGSVPIKMQLSNSREIETRKLDFCLRGEIDKTSLHKTKPRRALVGRFMLVETVRPRPLGNPARERKRGAPCGTMAHYGEMNFALLFALQEGMCRA
jgi:hypothetical protein